MTLQLNGQATEAASTMDTKLSEDSDEEIQYSVHSAASYSAAYHPRNILVDNPSDQSCRWSSSSNQDQYIILELHEPAIIRRINFGKFTKPHPCNLKQFKIYGGMQLVNCMELLSSGLRNDAEPESFRLNHHTKGIMFPVKYIKIVPLMAWGSPNGDFNLSIWFIGLFGIVHREVVQKAQTEYAKLQEKEAVRLCLKHFRQRNFMDSFEQLQKRTKIDLEAPVLTRLHDALVKDGNFNECERIVEEMVSQGHLKEYMSGLPYSSQWELLSKSETGQDESLPQPRGGHQMCINSAKGKIYLLGGFTGDDAGDLSDFWEYDILQKQWNVITRDTKLLGGPDKRSCHKMCINEKTEQLYILGRYLENSQNCQSDFYRYDIVEGRFVQLSADTLSEGGPPLIYDHQMCIDSDKNMIYVFGGRIIGNDGRYCGLYEYNCEQNSWKLLREDGSLDKDHIKLRSRIGHSMLFHKTERKLYFFAGQRGKEQYMSDFYTYDIDTNVLVEISRDTGKQGGPNPGYTQRATIDCDLHEFYVLSGLVRKDEPDNKTALKPPTSVNNSLWIYNMNTKSWFCAYSNGSEPKKWDEPSNTGPCPRFAHQLVYDAVNKKHYLFGGNPGINLHPELRLGDFWCLTLTKPPMSIAVQKCKFLLRRQRFKEMCLDNAQSALLYLQSELFSVVDHKDEAQSKEFRSLSGSLFSQKTDSNAETQERLRKERMSIYEQLLSFFPKSMTQPEENLVDLVAFNSEDMPK
eukprot:m.334091 g.334091  ORF g.334091 m.334091 type:complete len:745 (+) comp17286_c0_seq1:202-2436(+)